MIKIAGTFLSGLNLYRWWTTFPSPSSWSTAVNDVLLRVQLISSSFGGPTQKVLSIRKKGRRYFPLLSEGPLIKIPLMDIVKCLFRKCWLSRALTFVTCLFGSGIIIYLLCVQRWTIRWALGCVNPTSWLPLAMGRKFTQPRDHPIALLCTDARVLILMQTIKLIMVWKYGWIAHPGIESMLHLMPSWWFLESLGPVGERPNANTVLSD